MKAFLERNTKFFFDGKKRVEPEVITSEDGEEFLGYEVESTDEDGNQVRGLYKVIYSYTHKEELIDRFINKVFVGKDEDNVDQYIFIS